MTTARREQRHLGLLRHLPLAAFAAQLHTCFVEETPPVQPPGRELATVCVERQLAVERDARATFDERTTFAHLAEAKVNSGAHTLDVCVALTERADEAAQMRALVKKLSLSVEAPLVIDTTEPDVVAAALKTAPGRVIVNAVNMENGRQRIDAVVPLVKAHGAAVIALTIDEAGMAKTAQRKLEVAQKIYAIIVDEYGLWPDALIFDALTFTLATGDAEFINSAVDWSGMAHIVVIVERAPAI